MRAADSPNIWRGRVRRLAVDMLLALLVAWAGYAFYFQAGGARHEWRVNRRQDRSSGAWRLGSPQPERLRRCLVGMEPLLAGDAPVFLWDPANDLFRWRWAAYFLPGREVLVAGPGAPAGLTVIATSRSGPPGAQRLHGGRWCGIYRLP